MRPLESLVIGLGFAELLVLVFRRADSRWLLGTAALAVLAVGAQLLVEGPRWQMVPAYALSGLLAVASLRGPPVAGWPVLALAAVGLVLSAALPLLFPIFHLPEPTGPFAIGTVTFHWVDELRPETFTADPDDHRELMVQLWYPARADPSAPRAPYVDHPQRLAPLARLLKLPPFVFGHLDLVKTHAVPSAPVSEPHRRFPVLVFLHGRGGYRQHDTALVEELVSQGYVVAAVEHPYAAAGVVFPDGRQIEFDPRMRDHAFVQSTVPLLAQDAIFARAKLEALDRGEPATPLAGRLDLEQAGVFGVSLGGAVAAEACHLEPRFGACLAMDVWMPNDVVRDGLQQPAMWLTRDAATMQREGWAQTDVDEHQQTMRAAFERQRGPGYFVSVPGMFHVDFSDAPLLSPLTRWLGISGSIEPGRARRIVGAYVLAFFDRHLRGRPAPLLDGREVPFPEAQLEGRRP